MSDAIPPDDVFRWQCQAIAESLIEGSTRENAEKHLFEFVLDKVAAVPWTWDQALYDKVRAWEKEHGPLLRQRATSPRVR